MRFLCLLTSSAVLFLGACAEDKPRAQLARTLSPIENGQFDFENTAAIGMAIRGERGLGNCSGTLIAPNLVLTARHCVSPTASAFVDCGNQPFPEPFDGADVFVTTEAEIMIDVMGGTGQLVGSWFQGDQVFVPEVGNDICGFDMALVRLTANVPESITLPAEPRIDQPGRMGDGYTAVGYGSIGFARGGARKRLGGLSVVCGAEECGLLDVITENEWLGMDGVCGGDSGGPALDPEGRVFGVVSRGGQDEMSLCLSPVYTDVASFKDFIVRTALDAAVAGGYEPPPWAGTGAVTPPADPPDIQGQPCTSSDDCGGDFSCVTPTGESSDAICSASCTGGATCAEGFSCAAELQVCFPEDPNADGGGGGCSVRGASEDAVRWPGWLLLAGAAIARRRRKA